MFVERDAFAQSFSVCRPWHVLQGRTIKITVNRLAVVVGTHQNLSARGWLEPSDVARGTPSPRHTAIVSVIVTCNGTITHPICSYMALLRARLLLLLAGQQVDVKRPPEDRESARWTFYRIWKVRVLAGCGYRRADPYPYPLIPVPVTRTGWAYPCSALRTPTNRMSEVKTSGSVTISATRVYLLRPNWGYFHSLELFALNLASMSETYYNCCNQLMYFLCSVSYTNSGHTVDCFFQVFTTVSTVHQEKRNSRFLPNI